MYLLLAPILEGKNRVQIFTQMESGGRSLLSIAVLTSGSANDFSVKVKTSGNVLEMYFVV